MKACKSLPTRERGLKLADPEFVISDEPVAPHVGAWIETFAVRNGRVFRLVAPHAGAWIETRGDVRPTNAGAVAPHAGAWIETCRRGID